MRQWQPRQPWRERQQPWWVIDHVVWGLRAIWLWSFSSHSHRHSRWPRQPRRPQLRHGDWDRSLLLRYCGCVTLAIFTDWKQNANFPSSSLPSFLVRSIGATCSSTAQCDNGLCVNGIWSVSSFLYHRRCWEERLTVFVFHLLTIFLPRPITTYTTTSWTPSTLPLALNQLHHIRFFYQSIQPRRFHSRLRRSRLELLWIPLLQLWWLPTHCFPNLWR